MGLHWGFVLFLLYVCTRFKVQYCTIQSRCTGSAISVTVISYSLVEGLSQNSAQIEYRNSRNPPDNSSVQQQGARKQHTTQQSHRHGIRFKVRRPNTTTAAGSSSSERLHHWFPLRLPSANQGARRSRRELPLGGTRTSRRTGSESSATISDYHLVILTNTTAVSAKNC